MLAPITCTVVDAPIPAIVKKPRPVPPDRETMFDLLGTMQAGGSAIDVNRSRRSVQAYVLRFRRTILPESQFVLRGGSPGFTRIWRVK